ncbi:hypothetical protein GCM10010302_49370 [Streptomyces polychromogenes]|uniref:Integral membrane protein n=1 Tax=Streptomyces polychromogenes TaxID=67342 RepID=A0ABN0VIG9_9ACTN
MSQNFQPPAPSSYTEAPAPAPARGGNIGLGLVLAVLAAVVTAAAYGGIIGATEHQIGYAAVGVGFLIGLAAGRFGGANPVLPVLSGLLALGAVYAGEIFGTALLISKAAGDKATLSEIVFDHFSLVQEAWTEELGPLTILFFALGAYAAFQTARKTAA